MTVIPKGSELFESVETITPSATEKWHWPIIDDFGGGYCVPLCGAGDGGEEYRGNFE